MNLSFFVKINRSAKNGQINVAHVTTEYETSGLPGRSASEYGVRQIWSFVSVTLLMSSIDFGNNHKQNAV